MIRECVSKVQITCDSCKSTISLPDKGKSKENDERKKSEPVPLSAVLDHGMDGSTKEFTFCDILCLKNYLNDKYPNSKPKKKSKASILDVEVHLRDRQ